MPDLPFSEPEYARRMAAAREALTALGADCAVLMSPEAQYWLTGYDTFLGTFRFPRR